MSIPATVGSGAALGLTWGGAARLWMRLISTDPEFSWSGTGLILGFCAFGGLILGFLHGAYLAGWSRWWRLLAVLPLPIFAGPGLPFLPAYLLGGLLFLQRLPLRLVGAGALIGGEALLWSLNQANLVPVDNVTMYGGFLVLSLAIAAGAVELYRPKRNEGREKSTLGSAPRSWT